MSYFKKFPKIYYTLREKNVDVFKVVSDITQNVRVRKEVLSNITLWEYYDMKDGETPEILAEKVYGNASLHWVIMLANERYDVYNDFPLEWAQLEEHINRKYENPYAIREYRKDGFVVDSTVAGASAVTNRDYEISLNDAKRRIKLIAPSLINRVVNELNSLIQ
jgi:hypothetical protein